MTTANETRRDVMTLAWRKYRYELAMRRRFTFADAMVHAWAWVKGAAERIAAAAARAATPVTRVLRLSPSLIRSPIARTLAGRQFAGRRDFQAARTTAYVGR